MRKSRIFLNAVSRKIPDSLSEDRLMFSSAGAQPISPKLLKGLGCFPTRFCKRSARLKFCKTHEWVPPCIACQNGKLRCGYSPDLLAIPQGNPGRTTPDFASVHTLAVLAILQVQQVASTAIFSSGAPLDLLAILRFPC